MNSIKSMYQFGIMCILKILSFLIHKYVYLFIYLNLNFPLQCLLFSVYESRLSFVNFIISLLGYYKWSGHKYSC